MPVPSRSRDSARPHPGTVRIPGTAIRRRYPARLPRSSLFPLECLRTSSPPPLDHFVEPSLYITDRNSHSLAKATAVKSHPGLLACITRIPMHLVVSVGAVVDTNRLSAL